MLSCSALAQPIIAGSTWPTRDAASSATAEIVLAVGIVVRRKGDEAMNAPHDLDLLLRQHGGNARGDVDAPAGEGSPERIVQLANSRCRIHTLLM